jgi:hypothetical protein
MNVHKFSLYRLPAEIRYIIFEYALTKQTCKQLASMINDNIADLHEIMAVANKQTNMCVTITKYMLISINDYEIYRDIMRSVKPYMPAKQKAAELNLYENIYNNTCYNILEDHKIFANKKINYAFAAEFIDNPCDMVREYINSHCTDDILSHSHICKHAALIGLQDEIVKHDSFPEFINKYAKYPTFRKLFNGKNYSRRMQSSLLSMYEAGQKKYRPYLIELLNADGITDETLGGILINLADTRHDDEIFNLCYAKYGHLHENSTTDDFYIWPPR